MSASSGDRVVLDSLIACPHCATATGGHGTEP